MNDRKHSVLSQAIVRNELSTVSELCEQYDIAALEDFLTLALRAAETSDNEREELKKTIQGGKAA
jgi:hypothetical protein